MTTLSSAPLCLTTLQGGRLALADGQAVESARRNRLAGRSDLLEAATGIVKEIADECASDASNLHHRGEEVFRFFAKLAAYSYREVRIRESLSLQDSPGIYLFRRFREYFEFSLDRSSRQYSSKRRTNDIYTELYRLERQPEHTRHLDQRKRASDAEVAALLSEVGKFADRRRPRHESTANGMDLLALLLQHAKENSADHGLHVSLNSYVKAELAKWNELLAPPGNYYSAYPYCFLTSLGVDAAALVVVTPPDAFAFDEKVKNENKLPPVQLIIFHGEDLSQIDPASQQHVSRVLENAIGRMSNAVHAERAKHDLRVKVREDSRITQHWHVQGIKELTTQPYRGGGEQAGMISAAEHIREFLCAKVPENRSSEVYPFDRAIVFGGANYNAAHDSNDDLELWVLECGVMSKRPEDRGRFVTAMGRDGGADLSQYDMTSKQIRYTTKFVVPHGETVMRLADDTTKESLREGLSLEDEQRLVVMRPEHRDTLKRVINRAADEWAITPTRINANLASMFSRHVVPRGEANRRDVLQHLCMPSFRDYDQEGLCFLTDFSVSLEEVPYLRAILQGYFCYLDDEDAPLQRDRRRRRMYQDKGEMPKVRDYLNDEKRFFLTLISFDPQQHIENHGYLPQSEDYTILLIADRELEINELQRKKSEENLREIFRVIISHNLNQRRAEKEAIADHKDVLESLIHGMIHRVRHDLPPNKRKEVDLTKRNVAQLFEDYDEKELLCFRSPGKAAARVLGAFSTGYATDVEAWKCPPDDAQLESLWQTACDQYLAGRDDLSLAKVVCRWQPDILPPFSVRTHPAIFDEASRVLLNNAIEHAAIYHLECSTFRLTTESVDAIVRNAVDQMVIPLREDSSDGALEPLKHEWTEKLRHHLRSFVGKSVQGLEAFWDAIAKSHDSAPLTLLSRCKPIVLRHSLIPDSAPAGEVRLSCAVLPAAGGSTDLFEVSISNSSLPILEDRLQELNNADPKPVGEDGSKASSTGVGLCLIRKQLMKYFREWADIRIHNGSDDVVVTQFVHPALIGPDVESMLAQGRPLRAHPTKRRPTESHPNHVLKGYVLYVEDNETCQMETKQKLAGLTTAIQTGLFVTDNRYDALARMKEGMPSLVLLDLTVQHNAADKTASQDHGVAILEHLFKSDGERPPVLIISGMLREESQTAIERAEAAVGDADGAGPSGYTLRPQDLPSDGVFRPGDIYILPWKNLAKPEAAPAVAAVAKFLESAARKHDVISTDGAAARSSAQAPWVRIATGSMPFERREFAAEGFDEALRAYRTRNLSHTAIKNEAFVAYAPPTDADELFPILSRWMEHTLATMYEDDNDIKSVAWNDSFRNIVLWIQMPEDLRASLPIGFRYWALPYNILMTMREPSAELVWDWVHTPQGARGVVSKIRHDWNPPNNVDAGTTGRLLEKIVNTQSALVGDGWNDFKIYLKNDVTLARERALAASSPDASQVKQNVLELSRLFEGLAHVTPEAAEEFVGRLDRFRCLFLE